MLMPAEKEQITEWIQARPTDEQAFEEARAALAAMSHLDQVKLVMYLTMNLPGFCNTKLFTEFCNQDWVIEVSL